MWGSWGRFSMMLDGGWVLLLLLVFALSIDSFPGGRLCTKGPAPSWCPLLLSLDSLGGSTGGFVLCCWHLPLLPSLCCTPGSQWGSAAAQPAALCLWDRTQHISGIPVPANTLIPSVETPALQWWETFQICHITYGKKSPPVANCCAQRLLGVWSQNSINLWG